jgi:hypothetical protein
MWADVARRKEWYARRVRRLAIAACLLVAAPARAAEPTPRECAESYERGSSELHARLLLSARASFRACSVPACPHEVRKECEVRATDVEGEVPSILFDARDPDDAPLPEAKVFVDGAHFARAAGEALEVDPGDHLFRFETPGLPSVQRALTVRQGEKLRKETIAFARNAPAAPPPAPAGGSRTLAFVLGGVGVVGLGFGTFFGLRASSLWSRAQTECGAGCLPSDPAYGTRSDAQTAATVSTIAFLAGAAALAAGVVLYLTARPPPSRAAALARSRLSP